MSRKGPRGLTPEERDLWDRVKQQTTPMHTEKKAPKLAEVFEPKPAPTISIPAFEIGAKKTSTSVPPFPKASTPDVKMDRKAFGQLKRGKLKPEARLDLHGMTLAQAGPMLTRFIGDTHARGLRLVLVITGKGKDRDDGGPIPVPRGVLRRQVPDWLSRPPLSAMVLQVAEAHLKHGGDGAFYVYLRRRK